MRRLSKLETYVPISLFLIVVSFNFLFTYLDVNDDTYLKVYFSANELINAPLFVSLALLYTSYRHRLCHYNRISSLGLVMLNVINLIAIHTDLDDSQYYNVIAQISIAPIVLLSIILLINKK